LFRSNKKSFLLVIQVTLVEFLPKPGRISIHECEDRRDKLWLYKD
jgi:hypothetical protein